MTKMVLGAAPKAKAKKAGSKAAAKASPGAKKAKARTGAAAGRGAQGMARVEYIAKLDSKKRITVRAARSEYYAVTELAGGVIVLKPQVAFRLADLPKDVLAMIDEASANFKAGRVSAPIDLD
jgi:hypothetical protein